MCDVYRAPGVAQAASWWSRHRAEYCSVVERPRYTDSLVVGTTAAHTQAPQRSHQVLLQTSRLSQLVHGQFVVSALISPSAKPNVFVTRHCCTSNKEVMLLPWFVRLFQTQNVTDHFNDRAGCVQTATFETRPLTDILA